MTSFQKFFRLILLGLLKTPKHHFKVMELPKIPLETIFPRNFFQLFPSNEICRRLRLKVLPKLRKRKMMSIAQRLRMQTAQKIISLS